MCRNCEIDPDRDFDVDGPTHHIDPIWIGALVWGGFVVTILFAAARFHR